MISHPDGSPPEPYKWNSSTKHWDKQSNPGGAHVASSTPTDGAPDMDIRAMVANMARAIEEMQSKL